ncbi:MAG: glycoside hydrolase family 15 protein [Chloroflexi bacterium]|nr:glycoside hydrolase family 15 protein [Chloroflexota bacterium]
MPRDLPLGNGSLLVNFDSTFQLRDLYWPHVGKENHTLGHVFHFGVWVDTLPATGGRFRWLSNGGWQRQLDYAHDTLVAEVRLRHPELECELLCHDAVDFHENLYLRRVDVTNLADGEREVRLFWAHDFHISESEVGDTAYYEPERRALFHYKGPRWFMINGCACGEVGFHAEQAGIHQWACGQKEIDGREGTWRDAEDGQLSGNAIAQGSVDSAIALHITLPARGSRVVYYWMAVGDRFEEVTRINRSVLQRGPQAYLDRTAAYWRLWLETHHPDFGDLPHEVCHLYNRSLFIIRTQIDNQGGILAANDFDIAHYGRDTYSYVWPRDAALVAHALNLAGYNDVPRRFYEFCSRVITKEGFFLHKYSPDGHLGSSWHPWYRDGHKELPVQEDETALVIWALWGHFARFGDVEFIKPLYRGLICRAADFLASYRDPGSGLPRPSWDLWEERRGVHAFTLGSVWGGLMAASHFAGVFAEEHRVQRYRQAAAEIVAAADRHLWREELGRFARTIHPKEDGSYEFDSILDASLFGLWYFGMYPADDPRIVASMRAIRESLWVKTEVGGIARYQSDVYHKVSDDFDAVPGNPWFICSLWYAQWQIAVAKTLDELSTSVELLRWAATRALPSGVLAEQVHPYTDAPLSVSPLTWSHATLVAAVQEYLAKRKALGG